MMFVRGDKHARSVQTRLPWAKRIKTSKHFRRCNSISRAKLQTFLLRVLQALEPAGSRLSYVAYAIAFPVHANWHRQLFSVVQIFDDADRSSTIIRQTDDPVCPESPDLTPDKTKTEASVFSVH